MLLQAQPATLQQNSGSTWDFRPCVRQTALYRQRESGNAMKDIMGMGHLAWAPPRGDPCAAVAPPAQAFAPPQRSRSTVYLTEAPPPQRSRSTGCLAEAAEWDIAAPGPAPIAASRCSRGFPADVAPSAWLVGGELRTTTQSSEREDREG